MIKKEILQDLDGDDLTPPPCWIMTRLPPSAQTLELSRDCALPERQREGKRRLTVLTAAVGKSISGPQENLICPRDRTVLQQVPS